MATTAGRCLRACAPDAVGRHDSPHKTVVALDRVSWATFTSLASESRGGRLAYDRGRLEIISPSLSHENVMSLLCRFIEMFAQEQGIDLVAAGSVTLGRDDLGRDIEAGEHPAKPPLGEPADGPAIGMGTAGHGQGNGADAFLERVQHRHGISGATGEGGGRGRAGEAMIRREGHEPNEWREAVGRAGWQ